MATTYKFLYLEGISIRVRLPASFALERFIWGVQLLDVNSEVSFASTSGRTEFTLEHRLVPCSVNEPVRLQTVTLGESGMANVTLVWLFTSVDSEMAFQLERIRTGIGAMRALEKHNWLALNQTHQNNCASLLSGHQPGKVFRLCDTSCVFWVCSTQRSSSHTLCSDEVFHGYACTGRVWRAHLFTDYVNSGTSFEGVEYLPEVVKALSQNLHRCGLVPVWVLTWFWREARVLKPRSQTLHLCGLSSEWDFMCRDSRYLFGLV